MNVSKTETLGEENSVCHHVKGQRKSCNNLAESVLGNESQLNNNMREKYLIAIVTSEYH